MPTDCDVNQKSEPIWVLLVQSAFLKLSLVKKKPRFFADLTNIMKRNCSALECHQEMQENLAPFSIYYPAVPNLDFRISLCCSRNFRKKDRDRWQIATGMSCNIEWFMKIIVYFTFLSNKFHKGNLITNIVNCVLSHTFLKISCKNSF